jgi:hypothetical protein
MTDPFPGIGAALVNKLSTDDGLTALGVNEKVFPFVAAQNEEAPLITWQVAADVPYDDISGRASLYRAIVLYKVVSENADQKAHIEDALRIALRGYRGENLGVKIRGIHHLHSMDGFEGEILEYEDFVRFSVFYRREDPDLDESDS